MRVRAQSFQFTSEKHVLHEIAIITIEGGLVAQEFLDNARNKEQSKFHQALDSNREELSRAVFHLLEIPSEWWGEAVENRALHVYGFKKPWDITIATVNSADIVTRLFGKDLDRTLVLSVDLDLVVDLKNKTTTHGRVEVEVGPAKNFDKFQILGGKGRRVIASDPTVGYIMTAKLDRNEGAYPYKDPDWQAAAAHYARKHIVDSLTAGLEPSEAAKVTVETFGMSAITPLTSLRSNQSAKGIAVHVLVKGVDITGEDEADGFGLVTAQPISLQAMLPNGQISGMTPTVVKTTFRLAVPASRSSTRADASSSRRR